VAAPRTTQDGELQSVVWRDVFVILRNGRATVENQRELERRMIERSHGFPGGIGVMVLIHSNAPMPDEEVRRELVALFSRQSSRIRGLVWVIQGTGFQAAAVRAVLTSFSLAAKQTYPTYIANDVRSALVWLLPLLEGASARLADADLATLEIERARDGG
jgi:hypothetical protein